MGEFAKRANAVLKVAEAEGVPVDWKTTADEQIGRLRQHVPLAADVSTAKSLDMLKQLRELAYQLGYTSRLNMASPIKPELALTQPTRETTIPLPKEASQKHALMQAVTDPMRAWSQSAGGDFTERMKRKLSDRMRVTENPLTNPAFLPAAAIMVPEAFREGARAAETSVRGSQSQELDSALVQAKQDFEDALRAEYVGRKKISSAGELLDGLADKLIEKQAEGELATAANVYLALAALLGYGAHNAAKTWTEKRDPARQDQKMLHHALRQRALDQGVPVLVDFNSLPAAEVKKELPAAPAELPKELPVDAASSAPGAIEVGEKVAASVSSEEYQRLYGDIAAMKIPAATMKKHLDDMLKRGYSVHSAAGMGTSLRDYISKHLTKRISGVVK